MQWLSIKVATFWNNKKKDLLSHETGLAFGMAKFSIADPGTVNVNGFC